jgi:hypothetical protein
MMLDKVIEPDSLRAEPGGCSVGLRLPWYRTLPLSTVDVDIVEVDGRSVEADRLSLEVEGERWPVSELRHQTDTWWFVLDTARLHIAGEPLKAGETHDIAITVSLYPPYIRGLRRPVSWSRSMEVRA